MKLIFVHGSGEWGEIWHKQLGYFKNAEGITLPGHPEGKLCADVEGYVDWLHQYIESRGYNDVILAGHSHGGAIVMTHALKYPNDLKAIALVDTGARLRVNSRYITELEEAVNGNFDGWMGTLRWYFRNQSPEEQAALIQKHLDIGPQAQLYDLRNCDKFDVMDRVHEISIPTLVICGSEDTLCPIKYTNYLAQKIPGAKKVIIQEASHFVFLDKPKEFNKALGEFIEGLGQ